MCLPYLLGSTQLVITISQEICIVSLLRTRLRNHLWVRNRDGDGDGDGNRDRDRNGDWDRDGDRDSNRVRDRDGDGERDRDGDGNRDGGGWAHRCPLCCIFFHRGGFVDALVAACDFEIVFCVRVVPNHHNGHRKG